MHDQVGVLELDRPARRNALDADHCHALRDAVEKMVAAGARTIMITGVGRSFCSGADLGQVYSEGFRAALRGALDTIAEVPVPVIAAVNGPAIGAGTQLAITCDLRIASENAVFAIPTARLGLATDPTTIRRLVAVAGTGMARAMLLACETIPADRAYARGLVDRIGDRDAALGWALEVAAFSPVTQAYSKRAVRSVVGLPDADDAVLAEYNAVWSSEDAAEGQRANAEKRPPRFGGR
jgi:enoyl-CoA hydratase